MAKERLDRIILNRGLTDSREKAKRLILAGQIRVEGVEGLLKPGQQLSDDVEIVVKNRPKYVGRGGLKMEGALEVFPVEPDGKIALDAGASTGGFTDCLLQHGVARVYAYDVGTNQLAWKIRNDPRVISRERFNIRYMTPDDIPEAVDLAVIDVSFISLTRILGPVFSVLKEEGDIICLIKPQFELKKEQVGRGGIVRDAELHRKAVSDIKDFVTDELQKSWHGLVESPISGADGNIEFLAWLRHRNHRE